MNGIPKKVVEENVENKSLVTQAVAEGLCTRIDIQTLR